MEAQELEMLLKQVEEKGLDWAKVEEELKVPRQLLELYAVSGPVPSRIINNLKKIIEQSQN